MAEGRLVWRELSEWNARRSCKATDMDGFARILLEPVNGRQAPDTRLVLAALAINAIFSSTDQGRQNGASQKPNTATQSKWNIVSVNRAASSCPAKREAARLMSEVEHSRGMRHLSGERGGARHIQKLPRKSLRGSSRPPSCGRRCDEDVEMIMKHLHICLR